MPSSDSKMEPKLYFPEVLSNRIIATTRSALLRARDYCRSAPELHSMADGQRTQVVLLDERKLDIVVQPKLNVDELLNIVASHCNLKEPDKLYFGLAFMDDSQQYHWLEPQRRVLDHEFPKKSTVSGATLILYHLIKFFVDSVTMLQYAATAELFFLQAKQNIYRSVVYADSNTIFELAAYILQAYCGDYTDDSNSRNALKKLPVLPATTLRENASLANWDCFQIYSEEKIFELYKNHIGMTKGFAIVKYMSLVEGLSSYGIHLFDVKDKVGTPWWLGIGARGIFQYDHVDRRKPRRVFQWKQLENLYYRDRKFSVEVHDPRRVTHTLSSFNLFEDLKHSPEDEEDDLKFAIVADPTTQVSVSRRSLGPANVRNYAFYCSSSSLCKSIWSMAICQHGFYLDRTGNNRKPGSAPVRTANKLAAELNQSMTTIPSQSSDLGSSISTTSLQSIHSNTTEKSDDDRQREIELYKLLKERKASLELALTSSLKELKRLCIHEGEITGELPPEIQNALAPGEPKPLIKRRIGTTFPLSGDIVSGQSHIDKIEQLEMEIQIQKKITQAAWKLANDRSINRGVRHKRKKDWQKSNHRLNEMQHALHSLRLGSSKTEISDMDSNCHLAKSGVFPRGIISSAPGTPLLSRVSVARSAPTSPSSSVSDLRNVSATQSPGSKFFHAPSNESGFKSSLFQSPSVPNGSISQPSTPSRKPPLAYSGAASKPSGLSTTTSNPALNRDNFAGYRTNQPYQSEYRLQRFPTLPNSGGSYSSLDACEDMAISHNSLNEIPVCESTYPTDSNYATLPARNATFSMGNNIPLSSAVTRLIQNSSRLPQQNFRSPKIPSKFVQVFGEQDDVGAYNIPNQRTSWNQYYPADSIDNVNDSFESLNLRSNNSLNVSSGLDTADDFDSTLESSPSRTSAQRSNSIAVDSLPSIRISQDKLKPGNSTKPIRIPVAPDNAPTSSSWSGGWHSLDRRFLKFRNRTRTEEYLKAVQSSYGGQPPPNVSRLIEKETNSRTIKKTGNSPQTYAEPNGRVKTSKSQSVCNGVDLDKTLTDDDENEMFHHRVMNSHLQGSPLKLSRSSNIRAKSSEHLSALHLSTPPSNHPVVYAAPALNGTRQPNSVSNSFQNVSSSIKRAAQVRPIEDGKNNVVLAKPYETADFFKYSRRYRNGSSSSGGSNGTQQPLSPPLTPYFTPPSGLSPNGPNATSANVSVSSANGFSSHFNLLIKRPSMMTPGSSSYAPSVQSNSVGIPLLGRSASHVSSANHHQQQSMLTDQTLWLEKRKLNHTKGATIV